MIAIRGIILCLVCWGQVVGADDPARIIVRVDEVELDAGDLSLLLEDSLPNSTALPAARQASAAVLIRRTLAIKSLRSLGGKSLDAIITRELERIDREALSRGSSLAKMAESRGVSLEAYRRYLSWQVAWSEYLKSRLTEAALQSYFQQHRLRYGGREYYVHQIFLDGTEVARTGSADRDPAVVDSQDTFQRLKRIADELQAADDIAVEFASLASEISQSASAASGGKIGWVSKDGDLPPQVMAAIRDSVVTDSSEVRLIGPIRSPLGVHLLLVTVSRTREIRWEMVTDQARLRQDFADALFRDLVKTQSNARVDYFDSTLLPEKN